jgi:tetratricopeptide (TPR) repeat protein
MPSENPELLRDEGLLHLRAGRFREAKTRFREARDITHESSELALVDIHLASVSILTSGTSPHIGRLAEIMVRRFSERHSFLAAYYLVMQLVSVGQLDRAKRYLPGMIADAERSGDASYVSLAHESAADVASAQRRYADARAYSIAAYAAACESDVAKNDRLLLGSILHNVGYALLGSNHYEEAIDYVLRAIDLLNTGGFTAYSAEPYMTLAFAYCAIDRLDETEHYVANSEAHISEKEEYLRKYVYYLRAEVAQRRHHDDEAQAQYARLQECYPAFTNLSSILGAINFLPVLMPE